MPITKLVCLGDSLTEGYGIDKPDCWTEFVKSELKLNVINEGISGDSTGGMLARFYPSVIDHHPSHVMIMGGTNDLSMGLSENQILSNILSMTRQARHHNIEYLIGIPTPSYEPVARNNSDYWIEENQFREDLKNFQQALKEFCANDDIVFIDFSVNFAQEYFLEDGLHPNEQGQRLMADRVKQVLGGIS